LGGPFACWAGLYRFEPEKKPKVRDLDLRDAIERIALEFSCYGRPRMTAELKRRGWKVNHKRVGRILNHNLRVYPNLAGSMELTGSINCGWLITLESVVTTNFRRRRQSKLSSRNIRL